MSKSIEIDYIYQKEPINWIEQGKASYNPKYYLKVPGKVGQYIDSIWKKIKHHFLLMRKF